MNLFQAIRTLRQGKKNETPQEELVAAAKVVNARRNRLRFRRLQRMGYSEAEAKTLLYTAP
jgi:hypothetical protein